MSQHISQIILDKIQKENIKPKSRFYFVMEHAALWIPGVVITVLGAVAVAGTMYGIVHSGWEYQEFVYGSTTDFLLAATPFIWIVSFAVFSSVIVKALRTTHLGYRLSAKKILFGSLSVSVVAGFALYFLDESFKIDSFIRFPVHEREQQIWSLQNNGRLAGRIEKNEGNTLLLLDQDNILWDVDMSGFGSTSFPFVKVGQSIRIVGTTTDEYGENGSDTDEESHERAFVACTVFPWDIGNFTHKANTAPMHKTYPGAPMQNKNPDCKSVLEGIKQQTKKK